MKIWSKVIAAIFASILVFGVAGCASDDHKTRGPDQTGAVVSDSWITTKVKSDLAVEKGVPATSIHVDTYEGVVTLSGKVESQAEADKAAHVAKEIKGVKQVVNNIQVRS